MNCICGNKQYEADTINGLAVHKCHKCGLIRAANIPFSTEAEYAEYYKKYPPAGTNYKTKTWSHDLHLATRRLATYKIKNAKNKKLLDVGSGSGAFVDECRNMGIESYGCEVAKYHYEETDEYIYRKRLEDIYFPVDHFDIVTAHDVIEHVLNPKAFMQELFRITGQGELCIIDIPRFFHKSGKHHWKPKLDILVEHIWFFTERHIKQLCQQAGFKIIKTEHPIESKTVLYLTKPKQIRTKILLPPGLGDAYWPIVKLQSIMDRMGIKAPVDTYIVCRRDKYDGHKRAFPFIEMFPFINATWEAFKNTDTPEDKKLWRDAYSRQGKTIFNDKYGCDYFISYNGNLRHGKTLEEADGYDTNWYPPMFVSLEQEKYRKEAINKYGDYIICYFPLYGTFKHWTEDFSVDDVAQAICLIKELTGHRIVFAGAAWDEEDANCRTLRYAIPGHVDLTGKTTVEQLFGLIRGSKGVIGYPSGLTIMATVLKAQTLIIWSKFYNKDFFWNACPPDTKNKNYFIETTDKLSPEGLAKRFTYIVTGKKAKVKTNRKVMPIKRRPLKHSGRMAPSNISDVVGERKRSKGDGSLAVVCVLKAGGDFNPNYVLKLRNMVGRNTTLTHDFICLTDVNVEGVETVALKHRQYDRWWSKIELFRSKIIAAKRIVYFDLDTIITGNIDHILNCNGYDFIGLEPWNMKNRKSGMCASGLMSWINDGRFSYIYNEFSADKISLYSRGDQEYVSRALAKQGIKPGFFQRLASGIYSYKRQCRKELPEDAAVVCFHGKPRPREVNKEWVKDNWK